MPCNGSILADLASVADKRIAAFDCCNWTVTPIHQDNTPCDFTDADYFVITGDPPPARQTPPWPLARIYGQRALALGLLALSGKAFFEIVLVHGSTPILATDLDELCDRLRGKSHPAILPKPACLTDLARHLETGVSHHGKLSLLRDAAIHKEEINIIDSS